jgi:hypothetical protein
MLRHHGAERSTVLWLVLIVASFVTGLLPVRWWTLAFWPAFSIGVGIYGELSQPGGDEPGLAFYVGVIVALFCAAAWLVGRGIIAGVRYFWTELR